MKIATKPEIITVKLSDIKPNPKNPRGIKNEALSGLQQSLEKFGYVDLIVINKRNMQIVSGHQRFKVMQQGGGTGGPLYYG